MIAPAQKATTENQNPSWHAAFLALLPAIRKEANYAFRGLKPEAKEDAVEEVVANSCLAFARLVELGKADIAYASVLARFGIQQYRDGRRVGNRLRIGDVLSPYAQKKKGIVVESLDKFLVAYSRCTAGNVSHSRRDHTWSVKPAAMAGVRSSHRLSGRC